MPFSNGTGEISILLKARELWLIRTKKFLLKIITVYSRMTNNLLFFIKLIIMVPKFLKVCVYIKIRFIILYYIAVYNT